MSKKIYKIDRNNLPTQFPVITTILTLHLLYEYNPREWIWTVFIILLALSWIGAIMYSVKEKSIDIFSKLKKDDETKS